MNRSDLFSSIERWTGLPPAIQWRLVETLALIVVLFFVRALIARILRRTIDDPRSVYHWRKISSYVLAAVGIVMVTRIWFHWFGDVGTFLGLAAAGLAISLRDPIVNIVGWMFIITRRPFTVGDRVQVGTVAGDVIDQRIFQFSVLEIGNWVDADQSTGRIVHIPNGRVFLDPQANYTRGFNYIWNELSVTLTFASNWRKARELLQAVLDRHAHDVAADAQSSITNASGNFMIVYSKITPIVYPDVVENGVRLTMRYLCDPRRRRGTASEIWEDVLDAIANEPDLDYAYPTTRFVPDQSHQLPPDGRSID